MSGQKEIPKVQASHFFLKPFSFALIAGRWPSPFSLMKKYQKIKNKKMLSRLFVRALARSSVLS
jgi:hypothetical protein